MDIRNVQKTGNMFYVYLPTSWCKKNRIAHSSKVILEQDNANRLIVSSQLVEKKPKSLVLSIKSDDMNVIQKIIMSCYINPTNSFKIHLDKELNFTKLLEQKKLLNIEFVEMDKKMINCESGITVENPQHLLKNMVHKTKNLLQLMMHNYNKEIIERYEDEIDKNKILVDKAIITAFSSSNTSKLKLIDLYYISLLSKNVEELVDHLIRLESNEIAFFRSLSEMIDEFKKIVEDLDTKLKFDIATDFVKKASEIKDIKIADAKSYDKKIIRNSMINISEIILDWSITRKLEE